MHRMTRLRDLVPPPPRERYMRYDFGDDGVSSSERPVVTGPPQEGMPAQNSPEFTSTCRLPSRDQLLPTLLQIPESFPPLAVYNNSKRPRRGMPHHGKHGSC